MDKWILWGIITFVMLILFWPIGLFMLFLTPIRALIQWNKQKKSED